MAMHNEVQFESDLCTYLEAHGWLYSTNDAGYDRHPALFPTDVRDWLEETQPEELAKRVKPSSTPVAQEKAWQGVLERLATVLDKGEPSGGSLHVLRNGFKDLNASFTMMQKRPETDALANVNAKYVANRLRVVRQVHYSSNGNNSIDLVLFCNGIPVATVELKTDFTQSVNDAKKQYQYDRSPAGEPLLGFGTRALVHFAVSNDEVWMTTKLAGPKTYFLPFNRGNDGHAGNPLDEGGHSATTYLWRDVWQRDQWLDILGKFIHFETTKHTDPATGKVSTNRALIFPRFHQLDAVTTLVADSRASGPGSRYLVQHSAGSGKTRTIAWAAHRLATLHDDAGKVFDTVVVVTDRKVLDDQLQEAVQQIESKAGVVATISSKEAARKGFGAKSNYLTQALTSGKLIVVVTLQTFPFVLDAIRSDKSLQGRKFAVIADEAHSSQTGQAAAKLKQVLSAAEVADLADGGEIDIESVLLAEASAKADTTNISFYAFTATPKAKTLELFGTPDVVTGLPRPFHLYTMRQAIEERFILDVLANYSTYDTAYKLAQKVQAGQMRPLRKVDENTGELVDEFAATKGLMRWVKLHPTNIAQKVEIIVEHFEANVKHLLDGQAKAMVVTDSRKAAVRFKLAIDDYIAKHSLPEVTSLVAFSGEVQFSTDDPEPPSTTAKYTEASMNPGAGDLRKAFDKPDYRVMIVANKFQTGFDQNKLCAMYVDKRLDGVAAVQTLSRLNRYVPGKKTMVLDFANAADDMLAAFKPYYEEASIAATTDPNLIHDLQAKLDTSGLYTPDEVDAVVEVVVLKRGNDALAGAIGPATQRFTAALTAANAAHDKVRHDELELFRKDVSTYVRLYDFLSQIVDLGDTDVEKHAIFLRVLAMKIKGERTAPEVDLSDITLAHIKQKKTGQQTLDLDSGEGGPMPPPFTAAGSRPGHDPHMVLLAEIIARLNEQFAGEDFRNDQISTWAESLVAALRTDSDVVEQATVNNQDQFLASPTLRDAVTLAVSETSDAHNRMTELFHTKGGIETTMIELLGKLIYLDLHKPKEDATRTDLGFAKPADVIVPDTNTSDRAAGLPAVVAQPS